MQEKLVYTAKERIPGQNNFVRINESVGVVLKRLGWKVLNSTYLLSEGLPVEAYGYYVLPGIGVIKTVLTSEDSEYNFHVCILGFEEERQEYHRLKMYLEDTLRKVLHWLIYRMAAWNNLDIGRIIVYRNNSGENKKIAICNYDKEKNHILEILEYPIFLTSKLNVMGLNKNQEVKSEDYLERPGDWCASGNVSSEERSVLEKLAGFSKNLQI